ncbi:MAG: YggT family protein [Chloroflexaceae bacterium]|nr:YggT family protein [Chloroflexaceae bacterium]
MIAYEASNLIANSLQYFLQIYMVLIIIRVLLTWFQTTEWANNAIDVLSPVTDPYLNIFRSLIPPLGMMDISPIIAIFVLQILAGLFRGF